MRVSVTSENAPAAVGPYVHAVKASGELLFVSGQIPLDPVSGEIVGTTCAEQAHQALTNLKALVEDAGGTLAQAVKLTVYTTDLGQFAAINDVYAAFFEGLEPPARVAVGVSALPKGALVEVDAVIALS